MYLLDTETAAELRKASMRRGNKGLRAWAASIDVKDVYLSAITLQELEIGVRLSEQDYPESGAVLRNWMTRHIIRHLADRILPVNSTIALKAAELHRQRSRTSSHAFIAATASVHGLSVVTRSVASFSDTGVSVVNPWSAS
jgi:toxin FitB